MDAVVARLVVSTTQMWHKISLPVNGGKEIQKVQDYQTFPRCNRQINLMLSFSDDFLHKSSPSTMKNTRMLLIAALNLVLVTKIR